MKLKNKFEVVGQMLTTLSLVKVRLICFFLFFFFFCSSSSRSCGGIIISVSAPLWTVKDKVQASTVSTTHEKNSFFTTV